MCSFLKDTLSSFIAVCMYMNVRLSNSLSGAASLRKINSPPSRSLQLLLGYGWDFMTSSLLYARIVAGVVLHTQSQPLLVHMCNATVMSNKHSFAANVHYFWLLPFFLHPSMVSPEPWDRTENIYVSLKTEHSTVSFSLHQGQLGVSSLITIYYQRKPL